MRLSEGTLRRAQVVARQQAVPVTTGRVSRVAGLLLEASVPGVRLGDLLEVESQHGRIACEVVGFRDERVLAIPLGSTRGIAPGARLRSAPGGTDIPVGPDMFGRVVDAFCQPIDGKGPVHCVDRIQVNGPAPALSDRARVTDRFDTGVRAIDCLLTCGRGQRVGIFAGAGVGKSVLVEQIARNSSADVIVMGLIGERGREVRDLMALLPDAPMVIVAATSDRSPMERTRGARTATAVAEYFSQQGKNVLLIVDSLTRYAMALREVGLSIGEPPATKGYPPSVFAAMPQLLERVAPLASGGSITAFYTVLVEGDDLSDPIADSARSLLDAHLVLSRELAGRGHFPALDILASASRVARQVTDQRGQELALAARRVLADRQTVVELQSLGAYVPGNNPAQDAVLETGRALDGWTQQAPHDRAAYDESIATLGGVLQENTE